MFTGLLIKLIYAGHFTVIWIFIIISLRLNTALLHQADIASSNSV